MLFALLTVLCWSSSSIASARSAKHLGPGLANFCRRIIASIILAGWLFAVGPASWGPAAWWFVASGVIALGFGDTCLFISYQRLGARLPALFTHCLGAPLGAFIEWLWLGTALHPAEVLWMGVILGGVALALIPGRDEDHPLAGQFAWGCLFGVLSAVGLALGAVTSRSGYAAAIAAGTPMPGLDAALLRNLGGVVFMPLVLLLGRGAETRTRPAWRIAWPWLLATSILGPALGIAAYQTALARLPAGIVQAVLALVPVVVIPLVWWFDGERPRPRGLIGGLIGAAGVAGLAIARS